MISAKRIESIFVECLFKKNEIVDNKPILKAVYVKGILNDFGFNKERVESYRNDIQEYVNQLPNDFIEGWSFLNLCIDKEGALWGQHSDSEKLAALSIALGIAEYKMPKEYWHLLPGGMPYISFSIK